MTSESDVQNHQRLSVSQRGWRAFRNNRGVLRNPETGQPVRFGLANDSKAMGDALASGDLILVIPVLITPAMVGQTIGMFGSIECKSSEVKRMGNTKRDRAQVAWRDLIRSLGGYAIITNGEHEL
jgi:hypothetical protein